MHVLLSMIRALAVAAVAITWIPGAVAAAEAAPELRAVALRMREIRTLQVAMRQQKEMKAFGQRIESRGTLALARPRRLVMDLHGPGATKLVIDGDHMSMHYAALDKTERFDLARDPRAKAVADHLFLLLDADPDALASTYGIEVTTRAPLGVRLTPKAAALRKLIRHVDIRFDRDQLIDELVMQEENGDVTRWLFDEPVVNAPIDPARFALDG